MIENTLGGKVSGIDYNAQNMRQVALDAALKIHGDTASAETVIKSAEAFLAFLSGCPQQVHFVGGKVSFAEINSVGAQLRAEQDAIRDIEHRGEKMAEHNAAVMAGKPSHYDPYGG
jgi:hypothetical protein